MEVILRDIELKDLDSYYKWNHPDMKFHEFNGPYFERSTEEELKGSISKLKERLLNKEINAFRNKKIIADKGTDEIIGQVNWYWKSEETLWMEIGIVIFNENYWGLGIGLTAMKLWIDEVFDDHPEIVRLGLTTWSGNVRMMKLAEKLGFIKEAVYRKARIVNNEYYDSVSYGILREEWN